MEKTKIPEMVLIQNKLNAPKNQRNNFGGYNYRSCEDILEAVKPLLQETNCTLTVSDDIVQVSDRIYVKATATLRTPGGATYTTTAFAREAVSKKGMDDSQVTGSTSSYARKYALNGLFCIDDNKDPDALNNGKAHTQQESSELNEAFQLVKPEIETAPTQDVLKTLHADNTALHNYKPYREAMNKRYKELQTT